MDHDTITLYLSGLKLVPGEVRLTVGPFGAPTGSYDVRFWIVDPDNDDTEHATDTTEHYQDTWMEEESR